MAFTKFIYNLINWKNKSESLTTPLGASNLNKMDSAIKTIGDNLNTAYDELSEGKLDKDTANTMVKDVTYNDNSGIFTITKLNGTTLTIDTKLEMIVTNWKYDKDSQKLILTLDDGTTQEVDLSALITQYEFADSDTISFTVGSNGSVSANVKDGSITEAKLQPNYLAEIKTNASNAETSAQNASDYADDASYDAKLAQSYAVGGSGIRDGEDTDNAKYHAQRAKEEAEKVIDYVSGDFITQSEKGEANGVAPLDENALIPLEYVPDNPLLKDNASKNLLEVTATSQTINGVTFTVNDDGSVTVNGTASAVTTLEHYIDLEKGQTYILTGCPNSGNTSTYMLRIYDYVKVYEDTGSGKTYTPTEDITVRVDIRIANGYTAENLTFYPMIRRADIKDDTYEPYYATNKELTEIVKEGSVNSADKLTTPRKINGVDFDGSKDITVSDRKYCIVGNNSNSGWYKFASGTLSNNDNINVMFGLTSNYIQYFSGILVFQARCENSALTVYKLSWHTRIGFNADDVMCVVDGMSYTLYVKLRTSQYGRIMIERLMESTRATADASAYITLHNNDVVESTAPVATVTSTDGATVLQAIQDGKGNVISDTYFNKKTGDVINGHISQEREDEGALFHVFQSAIRRMSVQVSADNIAGMYDHTNAKWIHRTNADGKSYFFGNADTATNATNDADGNNIKGTYYTIANAVTDLAGKANISTKSISRKGTYSFSNVGHGDLIFISAGNSTGGTANNLLICQVVDDGELSELFKSASDMAITLSLSGTSLTVSSGSAHGRITVIS